MVVLSADCELSDDFRFDLLPPRVINTDMQASLKVSLCSLVVTAAS